MMINFTKIPDLKKAVKNQTVLHLGAHKGEEGELYEQMGVSKVVWVEGNDELIPDLKENLKKYPSIQHQVLNFVIGENDYEEKIFYITDFSQSSSILELEEHKNQHPWVHVLKEKKVTTRRLDSFFNEQKLENENFVFLNIDLQGAELIALKSMGNYLKKFEYINLEVNLLHLYKGCPLLKDLDSFLFRQGYIRMQTKITPYYWGDALYIRKKNRPKFIVNYWQACFLTLWAFCHKFWHKIYSGGRHVLSWIKHIIK